VLFERKPAEQLFVGQDSNLVHVQKNINLPRSDTPLRPSASRNPADAERPGMHSHAERGNEFKIDYE
jgi:hypothetical protein